MNIAHSPLLLQAVVAFVCAEGIPLAVTKAANASSIRARVFFSATAWVWLLAFALQHAGYTAMASSAFALAVSRVAVAFLLRDLMASGEFDGGEHVVVQPNIDATMDGFEVDDRGAMSQFLLARYDMASALTITKAYLSGFRGARLRLSITADERLALSVEVGRGSVAPEVRGAFDEWCADMRRRQSGGIDVSVVEV
jgi:hypothetical protein